MSAALDTVRGLSSVREHLETAWRRALAAARERHSVSEVAEAASLSTTRVHEITSDFAEDSAGGESREDTVVVAAKSAYDLYLRSSIYRCQPNRAFRPVTHIGFYRDRAIEVHIPRILDRIRDVELTAERAAELRSHGDSQLADAVEKLLSIEPERAGQRFQIFVLSAPDSAETLRLQQAIRHDTAGRGSAWTQSQRYTSTGRLRENPQTTDRL
jgi:hypothetical protein